MPDVNLGSIYTRLDLDTSALDQRVTEVFSYLEDITQGTAQTSSRLSKEMVSGLSSYYQKLKDTYQALKDQLSLMERLSELSGKTVTSGVSPQEAQKIMEANLQLEEEKKTLKELETQFNDTYNSMSKFINQQDKTGKKAEETARKMDMRQAGANMKVGTDLAASGLRTLVLFT